MAPTLASARIPVLIVGAGPVGLVAAIRLREQGLDVRIIDDQTADGKRTYPVLLHPRTLNLLDSLGMRAPLEWRGRVIKHLAVYTDHLRRVVLDVPSAEEVAPGAETLPQDVLRQALMNRLSSLETEVEWKTRLTALEQNGGRIRAALVRRERVESDSPQLKPEWLDVAAESIEADFVIGADGRRSTVRQALGIPMTHQGQREMYVFYDAADPRAGDEAQLVLAGDGASTVYPLQGELSRFSFQVGGGVASAPGLAELRRLLAARMPWYAAGVSSFEWCGSAEFHPAFAARFGEGRVWLAGDAAHSTGPLGGQSVNVGMQEASDLALRVAEDAGRATDFTPGARYNEQRNIEWRRLFGLGSSIPNLARAPDWVNQNITRLLACLPAAGDDLDDLLEQLRVRTA